MIRILYISLFVALVTATIGCNRNVSGGVVLEHATQVTFAQLKEATQGEGSFKWVGSKDGFHYFRTQKGFYRLSMDFEIPRLQKSIDSGFELGTREYTVIVDGDKIVTD